MCGILGFFSPDGDVSRWQEAFPQAVGSLAHRGPDGSGHWSGAGALLGHTRLAVLDLSDAGAQPMRSADGRFVLVFNGEIYNFRALRRELEPLGHAFRSQSDTEVLLAAWAQWGEGSLERLEGIFAFAVLDTRARTLTLARDHLGVKPLFFLQRPGLFGFASEPLALFGPHLPVPKPNPEDLDAYFTYNYLPAPRTGLEGVRQLPPGHTLRVDGRDGRDERGTTLRRYWSIPYADRPEPYTAHTRERFSELLGRAVQAQLVSDAPLGLFLSGGLDSYAVALAAAQAGAGDLQAFTLGFAQRGYDETPAASDYADHLGLRFAPTRFAWTEETILATLADMRELLADASCFPLHQLARHARTQATVVLAGDGGDELLAGYDTYLAGGAAALLRVVPRPGRALLRRAAGCLPADSRRYGLRMVCERLIDAAGQGRGRDHACFRRIFGPEHRRRLYEPEFLKAVQGFDAVDEYARLMDEVPPERSWLTARQHADISFHLPSILAKVDRMSMAVGLEVRVPLLDKALVEFCANLPDDAKRSLGKGKVLLRQHLRGCIPPQALKRPKAGFLPPVDQWFRESGPMRNVMGDALHWARGNLGWLRWHEVDKLWTEHGRGQSCSGFVLLGILQFINWSRQCAETKTPRTNA